MLQQEIMTDTPVKFCGRMSSWRVRPFAFLGLALVLVFQSMAFAADVTSSRPGARGLTLESALETALHSSPILKRAEYTRTGAHEEVNSAISAFLPRLDASLTLGRSNNPVFAFGSKLDQAAFAREDFQLDRLNNPDYRTNWTTRFVLTQPVFNSGREYIGYKISKAGERMAALREEAARQAVFFNVEQAYFNVILSRDAINVMNAAVRAARQHEKLARSRFEAGLVLKSDLLSATVYRTDTERELLDAENGFQIAMANLNRAMGTPQGTPWDIEPVADKAGDSLASLEKWMEVARASRPDLKLGREELEIAEYRKKGAEFRFLPSVNLRGVYQQDTDNPGKFGGDSWTFLATASFNIFNGLGDRARLGAASARSRAAQEAFRDTRARVELEVREAFYSWRTAIKQLEVTRAAVEHARESVRILRNRYDNGVALMVELLAADTMLKKQELQQARARFNELIAFAKLELSAGVLGAEISASKRGGSPEEGVATQGGGESGEHDDMR